MEKCATLHIFPAGRQKISGGNFWWKNFSKVKRRCFNDAQDPIGQDQLKNQIYLLRFSHTRALLLKKKWRETAIFPALQKLTHMCVCFINFSLYLKPLKFKLETNSIFGLYYRRTKMTKRELKLNFIVDIECNKSIWYLTISVVSVSQYGIQWHPEEICQYFLYASKCGVSSEIIKH